MSTLPQRGEPAWPLVALFKGILIAVWYDLSNAKFLEARGSSAVLIAARNKPVQTAWTVSLRMPSIAALPVLNLIRSNAVGQRLLWRSDAS